MAYKSIAFALLAVLLISQASARTCYECNSDDHEDCISNPRQKKYEQYCGFPERPTLFGKLRTPLNHPTMSTIFNKSHKGLALENVEYECITGVLTRIENGHSQLSRGCTVKFITDITTKIAVFQYHGLQVDNIRRCDADLCNIY